jgi:uncharacterized membrane protein
MPAFSLLTRRSLRRSAAALSLACAALAAAPALADLSLCNKTNSRVGVVIGYYDQQHGWTTEGWWTFQPLTCQPLLKRTIPSQFVYVHAVDYDRGGEWAGNKVMCTQDKAFTIRGAHEGCARRGLQSTQFFEVDTKAEKDWTIHLVDPSEGGKRAK